MLNKTETRVMSALYEECKNKRSALVSPADILRKTGGEQTLSGVEKIVNDLAADGYLDLVYSDRHGETVYCVSLTEKGKGFPRSVKLIKRNLIYRLGITVALAVLSFLIGVVLKAIFA